LELCEVFRIEWQTEMLSEFLTLPADLYQLSMESELVSVGVELGWLDVSQAFSLIDLPLKIGRALEADFVVNDLRVSRVHASIDVRSGNYVLEDTSSYGTWVRFGGVENAISLRRQECLLHSNGEIAVGAPFTDLSAPTVAFKLVDGLIVLG
jgi:adenylate cyclase